MVDGLALDGDLKGRQREGLGGTYVQCGVRYTVWYSIMCCEFYKNEGLSSKYEDGFEVKYSS